MADAATEPTTIPGDAPASDAAAHAAAIAKDGFTIVRGAIAPELVDALLAAVDALYGRLGTVPAKNLFEGTNTLRVYNLLAHGRPFDEVPAHAAVLPIVEKVEPGTIAATEIPEARPTSLSRTTDEDSRRAILLDEAHLLTRGVPEIVVAVLDTGVSLSHPELKHAILPGFDFVNILEGAEEFIGDRLDADTVPEDEAGHGSHVSGIIAGRGSAMRPSSVWAASRATPGRTGSATT